MKKKYLELLFWLAKAVEVECKTNGITNLATTAVLNTKATEIENKELDIAGFITTSVFNRLSKISFDSRIKEAAKSVARKSQLDNALDIADKSREKIRKLQTFDLSYFNGRK